MTVVTVTFARLGLRLIDLGFSGSVVTELIAKLRHQHGALAGSAKLRLELQGNEIVACTLQRSRLPVAKLNRLIDQLERPRQRRATGTIRPLTPEQWALVLQYSGLPHAVIKQYHIQTETLGVEEALWIVQQEIEARAATYNPRLGVKFSSYAFRACGNKLQAAVKQRVRHETREFLPTRARIVYGGGRDRGFDPAKIAEMKEQLQLRGVDNQTLAEACV